MHLNLSNKSFHTHNAWQSVPFGLFTGMLIVCLPMIIGCKPKEKSSVASPTRIMTVTTRAVEKQSNYIQERSYLGKIEPQRRSNLGFELPGKVISLTVEEGDPISEGSTIATLDNQRLLAARKVAEANLKEAQAANALALSTFERNQRAYAKNAISIQQLDESERNLDIQAARVARVEANIQSIQIDLDKSQLLAPFNARVARRFIDEGTVVNTGQPVIEIMETDAFEVRLGLDRTMADTLTVGQALQAYWQEQPLELTIERILPERSLRTRTIQVIASPKSTDLALREGDLIEVRASQTIEAEGFWLPINALSESSRGLWSCFVAEPLPQDSASDAGYQLVRYELNVLYLEKEQAYVSGSLQSGSQVLIEGIHRITLNQKVNIQEQSNQ